MERTLITWNLPNMITVPLMAAVGYLAVLLIAQLFQRTNVAQGGPGMGG